MSDGTTTGPEGPEEPDTPEELVEDLQEKLAEERAERKRLGGLVIGLIAFLGVLIVGLVLILLYFLLRGTPAEAPPSPSESPAELITPSPTDATPSPAPTETGAGAEPEDEPGPPPPPPGPDGRIVSFTAPSTPGCLSPEAPAYQDSVDITFTWSAENVSEVAFGVATDDAIDGPYQSGLSPSGSLTIGFPCSNGSQRYTLTVRGADGVHVSRSVTVQNPSAGG